MTDYTLDARGLMCPMPVIRTQDRVTELVAGDRLTIICSDPGAKNDIPAWSRVNGHTVEAIKDNGEEIIISVIVGAA